MFGFKIKKDSTSSSFELLYWCVWELTGDILGNCSCNTSYLSKHSLTSGNSHTRIANYKNRVMKVLLRDVYKNIKKIFNAKCGCSCIFNFHRWHEAANRIQSIKTRMHTWRSKTQTVDSSIADSHTMPVQTNHNWCTDQSRFGGLLRAASDEVTATYVSNKLGINQITVDDFRLNNV